MPVYEYRCRACGNTFEELRQVADADSPATCACGEGDIARLPSMIAPRTGGGDLPMAGSGGCCGGGACGCGH